MKTSNTETMSDNSESEWLKTPVSNLVKSRASGVYFVRCKIRGKLFRASLKTDVLSVAKLRLNDFVREKQELMGDVANVTSGKMTVADAIAVFRQRLEAKQDIKPGAKLYRSKTIDSLTRTWPGLEETPINKIGKDDCLRWAKKLALEYSPSVYNNVVGTLRRIFDIAIEKGVRANNPARFITKKKIQRQKLVLPSPEQFARLVDAVANAGGRFSRHCADLIEFLAYGGFRKNEAAHVLWSDCDFDKQQIQVRVTKNGDVRYVPMVPDMEKLLRRLLKERPDAQPNDAVMLVHECQKAVDRATKEIGGLPCRVTHHTLRHYFCSRALQCQVPVATLSFWVGHKDGGSLLLKTYSHFADAHSKEQAARVTFSPVTPANVHPISAPAQAVEETKEKKLA